MDEYYYHFANVILGILEHDNEANAMISNRILIDIIKFFKNQLNLEKFYINLFNFLEQKTEFLQRLGKNYLSKYQGQGLDQ